MKCPHCNTEINSHRNPTPTVDIIIEVGNQIVLIERRFRHMAGHCPAALLITARPTKQLH